MFLTPFSTPIGYTSPDGKGIYLKPTSEEAPNGWGEPRIDTNVVPPAPIVPGTPGGPQERVLLRKIISSYKASASKTFQKSGNITWWGDLRDASKASKGRTVLSYHGPKLRYFYESGFNYGDSPEHNEIYYMGRYAAVAPGPVLGACLRKMPFYNPLTQKENQTELFLIVAVYMDGQDRFYRRRWAGQTVKAEGLTDAVRQKQMEMYDQYDRPYGWMLMGTVERQGEAFPPETPWFFNRSGTEASCMRRIPKTFNNNGEDVTEDMLSRYKVTVGQSIVFDDLGNLPPMQYSETFVKLHPTYTSTDPQGYSHSWQEDHVKVRITLEGSQYVMCDYIEDTLYYGKLQFNVVRVQEQYYTRGTDPAVYTPPGFGNNISNLGLRLGPRYHNYLEYGTIDNSYIPAQGDHEATTWINVLEKITLFYTPDGGTDGENFVELHYYDDGTSDEWAGSPRQSNNPYLYYYQFYTRWLRGMFDIRNLAFFSHDEHKYGLRQNQDNSLIVSQTEKSKEVLYTEANLKGEILWNINKAATANSDFGWTIADMESWPETFDQTITRTTYDGSWPGANFNGDLQKPGSKTFYANEETGYYAAGWPSIPELLYGSKNVCKGNGVVTDANMLAYSIEVPYEDDPGNTVIISGSKPAGDLEPIVGYGKRFYPVGTC